MSDIIDRIWARRYVFLSTFFVIFTLSYITLMALDFLPEPPAAATEDTERIERLDETDGQLDSGATTTADNGSTSGIDTVSTAAALPLTLSIAKLDKTVTVHNPSSRSIADLDAALLEGVVRHPDSATMTQDGNVFILGHSSYLPQVFNKNFQAFNGIQNLEWGDMIEVFTSDMAYTYRVEKVYRARAQEVTVPIAGTGKILTLATCNSFGSVDDRYIVEAKQVETRSL